MILHKKCNSKVEVEHKLDYPYFCIECDENVYEFETIEVESVTCPYCEGYGMVDDFADDVIGNTMGFSHSCDCCEGVGEVPKKDLKWIKEIFPKTNRQVIEDIEKGV